MAWGLIPGRSTMTPASLAQISTRGSRRPGRRRRKKTRAKGRARAARRSPQKRSIRRKSRMKFGSPAWQKKYKVGRFRKKRR